MLHIYGSDYRCKCEVKYTVAIRTAPVRRLVFAIRTGVRRFHRISLKFLILAYPNYYIYLKKD